MTETKARVIRLNAKNPLKQANIKARPCEDHSGRIYTGQGPSGYGFITEEERLKNTDGIIIDGKTTVVLKHGKVINLADPIDAANWRWLQHSPYIAPTKNDMGSMPDARFYIEDRQGEAETFVKLEETKTEVKYLIRTKTNAEKRKALAKVLGLESADGFSEETLLEYLYRQVEEPAQAAKASIFLNPKNAARNEALVMLKDLITFGLVTKPDGMLRYGGAQGTALGLTEDDAVNYILANENREFVASIDEILQAEKAKRNLS